MGEVSDNDQYFSVAMFFTSPRLRGEHRLPSAAVLVEERRSEASAIAQRRVRGTIRESEPVESPPHPGPLRASFARLDPAGGEGGGRPARALPPAMIPPPP